MFLFWVTTAHAADGQGLWDTVAGASPIEGTAVGLGVMVHHNDLFEQVDPALKAPIAPAAALNVAYYGAGAGMYDIECDLSQGGGIRRLDTVSTQAPPTYWLWMTYGLNPLGFKQSDFPVGIGPELSLHGGAQTWSWVALDKVGEFRYAEWAHAHLGVGVQAYIAPFRNRQLMLFGDFGYMPTSQFTFGQFGGAGRFQPGATDIAWPADYQQHFFNAFIESQNAFSTVHDLAASVRLVAGPVSISWQFRSVLYGAKPGAHQPAAAKFDLVTNVISIAWASDVRWGE